MTLISRVWDETHDFIDDSFVGVEVKGEAGVAI